MQSLEREAKALETKRAKAEQKVKNQSEVVARLNGGADRHPEEQQLLSEMRQNQSAIEFNRALLDYGRDDETSPQQPSP